ncbi:hypothetical protein C6361_34130 [Plantactinospora sp. BC1]|nr:hypothetical protein C6361_34130 [Plantactinospora sp. BC1]
MRAEAAAWGVLATGASGQVAVEILAGDGVAARATALSLTVVLLGANAAGRRHPQWISIAVCVASLPLWVSHGAGALSMYDPGGGAASALSPVLLIVGTLLLHVERQDRPARGEP